jgi:hypothetical protein
VPQEQGLAPNRGGLEIADGLCTRPAQVPNGCLVNRGDVDGGEGARAHQAGQLDGIPTVGVDAIPGLCGDSRGRHDPAPMACVAQRTGEPGPTGACRRDKDELLAFGRHLPDAWIEVTLSCPDVTEGDDVGVVFVGDVGNGARLFMDIQSDGKRARRGHG